jgi:acyl-CoA-binding protein
MELAQDKAREQFEAWANLQGVSVKRVSERENALYTDYATYLAWQAWMQLHAATAAASQDREELVEALSLVTDLSSQEWQQPDGKRMGATDNQGRRMWFISEDVMQTARALIAKHRS